MSRYTPPQRPLKLVPAEPPKNSARYWMITWNVLLFALAICFMVMSAVNQWFCVAVLAIAPLVYFCFMKEEVHRTRDDNPPRLQRTKQLRLILAIAMMVAFLVLLGQL